MGNVVAVGGGLAAGDVVADEDVLVGRGSDALVGDRSRDPQIMQVGAGVGLAFGVWFEFHGLENFLAQVTVITLAVGEVPVHFGQRGARPLRIVVDT